MHVFPLAFLGNDPSTLSCYLVLPSRLPSVEPSTEVASTSGFRTCIDAAYFPLVTHAAGCSAAAVHVVGSFLALANGGPVLAAAVVL